MSPLPYPSLLSLLLFIIISSSLPNPSEPSITINSFIYGGCSQLKYAPGSPYESNINSLLTSLVNSASLTSYNNFTILGTSPQDVVYGLYQCRGDLTMLDCATCVAHSVSQVSTLCFDSCGATLQLQGCFVKYDNTTFLGMQDKTVVSKKCGPSIGNDENLMSGRDAVLGGLASGGGPYRVGGSGNLRGMTQCVGDLSSSECQDCISEAIQRLKTDCGTSESGDMFLGKCYARFSNGGSVDSKAVSGKRFYHPGWWFLVLLFFLNEINLLNYP